MPALTSTLQVPPALASLRVIVDPWHTMLPPRIAPGFALTLTVIVVLQPDEIV